MKPVMRLSTTNHIPILIPILIPIPGRQFELGTQMKLELRLESQDAVHINRLHDDPNSNYHINDRSNEILTHAHELQSQYLFGWMIRFDAFFFSCSEPKPLQHRSIYITITPFPFEFTCEMFLFVHVRSISLDLAPSRSSHYF